MKSNRFFIPVLLFVALVAGCGGGGGGGGAPATKTLVSIAITPANPSIAVGGTQPFSATGTFSDGSIQQALTVTWSSTATPVATISSSGLATAVAVGATTITATSGSISGSTSLTITGGSGQPNVLAVTVNGALCSSGSYHNKPCVSVTICTPGTSTCQTVNDILLDTGSYGLRIFKQALSVTLPQVTVASGSLANCVQFGDGSSQWGPVQTADVVLGSEPAVQIPIQVVDSTFGTRPTACSNAQASPSIAGFNGILGVGLFKEDCGTGCVSNANNRIYFACNGSACSSTAAPLASQLQNPVAHLPLDNNGVLVQLPGVALGGAVSVNGSLVLGIGTRSNNTPAGVTLYRASQIGEFTTTFNSTTYSSSFIDSGSNGLYFNAPASLSPICPSPNGAFYCPSTTQTFSATNTGFGGSPSGAVSFQIGNFNSLISTSNNVFIETGGTGSAGSFDWGLPFFLGRSVFVGIEGTSSSLGTGPYWAY